MAIKKKPAGRNEYGEAVYELRDELNTPIVSLTGIKDGDGTLRVTATVTGSVADDIIAGLRLLSVMRQSV